jgi:hypothetical protein
MLNRSITILLAFMALFCVLGPAQEPVVLLPGADRADQKATYGRVKEFTAGQKIVIDVDNAPDKNHNLTDTSNTYKLASDLKVGDPVMITQSDVAGRRQLRWEALCGRSQTRRF